MMFVEHVRLIGGFVCALTMTRNEQLVVWPQLFVAVTKTVLVPIGKVLPLGGVAMTKGGGLHPPVALTLKKTTAPFELVAVTVMFVEHVRLIGEFVCALTVTWKEQFVEVPQLSLAVTNTGVVPMGKVLPLGGLASTFGGLQPPVALTLK